MSAITNLLVVDSDGVVRRRRSLCGSDCVTQGAPNGADALAAMQRDPLRWSRILRKLEKAATTILFLSLSVAYLQSLKHFAPRNCFSARASAGR